MKKLKAVSIILAAVLVCGLVPATAEVVDGGNFGIDVRWVIDENGLVTISGSGKTWGCTNMFKDSGSANSPWYQFNFSDDVLSAVAEDGITGLGMGTFEYCSNLQSVKLADSVSTIGEAAFRYCSSLRYIDLPEGTAQIGDFAFDGSGLNAIVIPDNVTGTLGKMAFRDCTSLEAAIVGDGISKIGNSCFSGCENLTKIYLPAGLTLIYAAAFENCGSLTDVYFGGFEEDWGLIEISPGNECLTSANIHFLSDKDELEIREEDINDPAESNIVIDVDGGNLTISGSGKIQALQLRKYSSDIETITIEDGITSIADSAFKNFTKLRSVSLPDSICLIGAEVFYGCVALENVTLPKAVNISDRAFCGCTSLKNITVPQGVQTIGESAFYGCSALEKITIPKSMQTIKDGAFAGCPALAEIDFCGSEDDDFVRIYGNNDAYLSVAVNYIEEMTEAPTTEAPTTEAPTTEISATEAPATEPAPLFPLGDVNHDGKVKAGDARLTLRFAAGLEAAGNLDTALADVNTDGKVKANDARLILRAAAGLENL